jgi:hypothetical protein
MSFWDNGKARDMAGQLMAAFPAWLVLRGTYTRGVAGVPALCRAAGDRPARRPGAGTEDFHD